MAGPSSAAPTNTSPAAEVKILKTSKQMLTLKMPEAGPLTIYSQSGVQRSAGLKFKLLGNGLYQADLPIV